MAPYEWVPDLLRVDPPTVSESPLSASMLEHAIQDPGSFRSFIELKARELAGPACTHTTGLIKWNRDKSATTCGKLQAHLLANVDLQVRYSRGSSSKHQMYSSSVCRGASSVTLWGRLQRMKCMRL